MVRPALLQTRSCDCGMAPARTCPSGPRVGKARDDIRAPSARCPGRSRRSWRARKPPDRPWATGKCPAAFIRPLLEIRSVARTASEQNAGCGIKNAPIVGADQRQAGFPRSDPRFDKSTEEIRRPLSVSGYVAAGIWPGQIGPSFWCARADSGRPVAPSDSTARVSYESSGHEPPLGPRRNGPVRPPQPHSGNRPRITAGHRGNDAKKSAGRLIAAVSETCTEITPRQAPRLKKSLQQNAGRPFSVDRPNDISANGDLFAFVRTPENPAPDASEAARWRAAAPQAFACAILSRVCRLNRRSTFGPWPGRNILGLASAAAPRKPVNQRIRQPQGPARAAFRPGRDRFCRALPAERAPRW